MQKTLLTGLLLLSLTAVKAQTVVPDVLASSGDFFSNSSGMIQWTIGETMVETYTTTGNFLTQGFHQTFIDPNGVAEQQVIGNLTLFPNPASDQVSLQFDGESSGAYIVEVYNALGQLMNSQQVSVALGGYRHDIVVRDFADGIYFVTVRKVGTEAASSFRINKVS